MPTKPKPVIPVPPKEPVAYELGLSDRRKVSVTKEPDGRYVLSFRIWEGAIRVDSTWRLSPEATQALYTILSMHGLQCQPIATTMEIPSMTWKPVTRPVNARAKARGDRKKAKRAAKKR
jgi:hypothetical protein